MELKNKFLMSAAFRECWIRTVRRLQEYHHFTLESYTNGELDNGSIAIKQLYYETLEVRFNAKHFNFTHSEYLREFWYEFINTFLIKDLDLPKRIAPDMELKFWINREDMTVVVKLNLSCINNHFTYCDETFQFMN